ncbi:hypothetical protein GLA29479_2940 [Lysobacter antibioticus]|uniref:hypothetical protein n=1 Tax=Lysobacter antibioticus TaxID=84531 RepID=UPI0007170DCC|nr:hypothetical protein [Lysobacter antibioticus]ALN63803.1 hypothetical protein GLA29479_2940 [Lysobacter antibioticus]
MTVDGNDGPTLQSEFDGSDVAALIAAGPIQRLTIDGKALLTKAHARELSALPFIDELRVMGAVTRRAMQHVLGVPQLRELDVGRIRRPGRLQGFGSAEHLRVFREHYGLAEMDILEVARSPGLTELSLHSARLTHRAFDALMEMPALHSLDIEGTPFDDVMAASLKRSATLLHLDAGRTRVTGRGLAAIREFEQLRSLDLWCTNIPQAELNLLCGMPMLEYLSLGCAQDEYHLHIEGILPILGELPSLQRLWLDGIEVPERIQAELKSRYAYVRIN